MGTSLAIRWLRLTAGEHGLDPWSVNQDPACQVAQTKNQNPSYLLNQEQTWPVLRKLQRTESLGQKSCCWYLPLHPIPQQSQGGAIFDPASPQVTLPWLLSTPPLHYPPLKSLTRPTAS